MNVLPEGDLVMILVMVFFFAFLTCSVSDTCSAMASCQDTDGGFHCVVCFLKYLCETCWAQSNTAVPVV